MADVRFVNLTGTWFLVIREGNHSASEAQIPFAFLAGPHAIIDFHDIHFERGEYIRFTTERWAPPIHQNPATLAMVAIDLIGRGLFGVEAPGNLPLAIVDELLAKLEAGIAGAFGSVGYIAQAIDALRRKELTEAVYALAAWLKSVDPTALVDMVHDIFAVVSDETADGVANALAGVLTDVATVAQIADAFLQVLDVFDFPRRYQSMKKLGQDTNSAPLDGYTIIRAQ